MEIPASLFLGFSANIAVVSLYLGFSALNATTLPASLPPAVLFHFKHFIAIAASHSSTHSLVFRIKLNTHVLHYYALFSFTIFPIAFAGEPFAAKYFKIYSVLNAFVLIFYFLPWKKRVLGDDFFNNEALALSLIPLLLALAPSKTDASFIWSLVVSVVNFFVIFQARYAAVDGENFCLLFHFMAMYNLLMLSRATKDFSPILVLSATMLTCIAHASISGDERFLRWMPAASQGTRILSLLKRITSGNGDVVEFSIGMAGTILFQYFFRLTSFDHVVAFLYFAVGWLANLAVLLCRRDFGVFNFLLSNVIVGCTVSEFGVGRTTWLAYGATLLLYVLRVKLNLLCLVNRDNREAVVSWRQNHTQQTV